MTRRSSSAFLRSMFVALVLALLASVATLASSQTTAAAQELDTTMLVFDLSGSMGSPAAGGGTRLQVAQTAMIDAVSALAPGSRNVGIRSFSDCGVTALEHPPAPVDAAALTTTINSLTARNSTDISVALTAVASDFTGQSGRHTVILLSDGAHNCGGDPCVTAQNLIASGFDLVVHTVGLETAGTSAETQLACIAGATGGTSISVESASDLFDALDTALTGDAVGAFLSYARPACINSPLVQGNDALKNNRVGDSFRDASGALRIITTGANCDFACHDGSDMNCDDVLGDFCPSEYDRNLVLGAGQCVALLNPPAPSDADVLSTSCAAATPPGSVRPLNLEQACDHYDRAQEFFRRADAARSNGDRFLAGYLDILGNDQLDRALAAL